MSITNHKRLRSVSTTLTKDVWVKEYNQIKQCEFVQKYEAQTVVLFHGCPEIHLNTKVFDNESSALASLIDDRVQEMTSISKIITSLVERRNNANS